jgi:DNA-binding transcriptional regulator YiaG
MIDKISKAIEKIREVCQVRTHHGETQVEKDRKRGRRLTRDERVGMRKRINAMRAQGMNRVQIAKVLGVAPQTVSNWGDK